MNVFHERLIPFVERARLFGWEVEPVPNTGKSRSAARYAGHSLLINKFATAALTATTVLRSGRDGKYPHMKIVLSQRFWHHEFGVFRIALKDKRQRFIVMPVKLLREAKISTAISIPLEEEQRERSLARINYWEYEDAWYLFSRPL